MVGERVYVTSSPVSADLSLADVNASRSSCPLRLFSNARMKCSPVSSMV